MWTTGDRIRAARHLAGFRRVEGLAAAIREQGNHRGLGTTTLREIERDEKPYDVRDLDAIALACGVPVEWFTADFSRLAEISPPEPRKVLAQQTAEAVRRFEERRAGKPAANPPLREAGR